MFREKLHTVAIALSPATPAPMTKTLQGGIYNMFGWKLTLPVYGGIYLARN